MVRMRVVRHEANDEKDAYKVELIGQASDMVDGSLVDVTIRLKAKTEDILEKFPRGTHFQVKLENDKA